jgi:hypothetical protein
LTKLNSNDEARVAWRALIDHNPDNLAYYSQYFAVQNIDLENVTDEQREKVVKSLKGVVEALPYAAAPRRITLSVVSGT